ncbi:MAG: histidine phosphatase family protein [Thermanaerothrix sp.]|uniref:Histidine phosphatase family protein n=1 Tax=Thermanaerothrix solaris TaxID=3058434 RepID=A0ABU3NQE4_9CHLR|nr:histidine phosphatase family protein [Thermanaerothrix sp. 4228-RoL]MDT8899070.1 histidine phosphatase family protein [Thermanaerothrix sp. 4228-RoL]
MTKIVLLIRHAENDVMYRRLAGRLPGVHLNRRGQQQALGLARMLLGMPVQALYTSPLERAVETAQPLARALGLGVEIRPGLNEIDFGRWQGRSYKQLQRTQLWRVLQATPSRVRFPEGEALSEAQQRVVAELESLAVEGIIACVTHADVIRLALLHFLNMTLDDLHRLIVAPASLSAILLGEKGPQVLFINRTPELEWPSLPVPGINPGSSQLRS